MEQKIIPSQGKLIASTQELASSTQTSQKKIEANRRNALHSTGPKTGRGKRAVSRNAMKHGLLARETTMRDGLSAENVKKFDQLVSELHEDYQPVGISEELLVSTIATCYWRLRLVFRLEMGETRKRPDSDAWLHTVKKMTEINRNIYVLEYQQLYDSDAADRELSIEEWFQAKQRQQIALLTHPLGIKYVRDILADTKAEIQEKGSLSNKSCKHLMATIGACDRSLVFACASLVPEKNDDKINQVCDPNTKHSSEQTKVADTEVATGFLDKWLGLLEFVIESALKHTSESDLQVRSLELPDMEVIDKVLRYEAHLDRKLYRAMDQLERLQRCRKGENVPPPLNLNLGRRG